MPGVQIPISSFMKLSSGKEVNISESNRGYDKYPVFSPDGSKIAFQSMERDGYEADLNRLFVYDIKTGTSKWITKGWDFDVESVKWADDQTLYFVSAYLGTSQVFKTTLAGQGVDQVTKGNHELGSLQLESGKMVGSIMSFALAPEVASVDLATGEVKQVTAINKSIYDSIRMGKFEEKYTKTKDGQGSSDVDSIPSRF